MLYIFSGLPGADKSELAKHLAETINACYVRIDSIEQALRDQGIADIEGKGYSVAYKIAGDNLRLGLNVIADSVNPIALTRTAWNQVALEIKVPFLNIEVICSDNSEHKRRVEDRKSEIANVKLPSWEDVLEREYEEWNSARVMIDTGGQSPDESKLALRVALEQTGTKK